MNLDQKLELADEMALAIQKTKLIHDMELVSAMGWKYADAMEVEYNKRKQAESEQNAKQSKILFEQLTKNKDGSCAHFCATLTECFDCGTKLQDEFQVDWSVAPNWANWWLITSKGQSTWIDSEPRISNDGGYWCLPRGTTVAPSFNYQGDWKDSLRKRP